MKPKLQSISTWLSRRLTGVALPALVCWCSALALAQSSVEKAETTQQAKELEVQYERAKVASTKPGASKPTPPETGRQWGAYSTTSSLELGYRSVDAQGDVARYLSDVNVRDGFRVLDYSLDMRAQPGAAVLFDFLKLDVDNAGGDVAQNLYLRTEKTRIFRFDSNVRRFNYFRSLGNFAAPIPNVTWREHDLRQQVSDYNLKLFPQRAVRVNLGYSNSLAKGRFTPTYSFERDIFKLLGEARWNANDYRIGLDASYRKWEFNVEQLYRNFHNDPQITAKPGGDLGFNPSEVGNGRIDTLLRDTPFRSRAFVTRAGVHGTIAERLHVAVRALHDDERVRAAYWERDTGRAYGGATVVGPILVSRTLTLAGDGGIVERPGNIVDAGVSFDVNKHLTISNTFNYTAFRISGDMQWSNVSITQPATGPQQTTSTLTVARDYLTNLSSYRNTLEANLNYGRKFSANLGWRTMNRDVTIGGIWNATAASPIVNREEESIQTNAFIGGVRLRPTKLTSFIFDVEHGQNNNAFIRIAPLDFTRFRVRAQVRVNEKLGFNGSFTSLDRRNPTRLVENESDIRTYTAAVNWEPHARASLDFGYDYNDLFATALIDYTLGTQRIKGNSLYYARLNSVFFNARFGLTNRLDLLMVYYYLMDRGNPSVALGPNDQINSYPLRRHNPEARLAYRFSNHLTANLGYRHYSYNERDFFAQDYRSNILTTSLRFTF